MKPQLSKGETQHRGERYCSRCDVRLPNHYDGCPAVKEKTPKPWRKHNNRSNRTPEDEDGSQDD